jgi:hypothetical protein
VLYGLQASECHYMERSLTTAANGCMSRCYVIETMVLYVRIPDLEPSSRGATGGR